MPSDFAPVRSILAAEREQGRPFAEAWPAALEAVEDRYDRQVLRDTRQAWQDGYERRESKMRGARLMHGLMDTRRMMSEESTTPDLVELVGRALEAVNRRDLDAVASSFAEDATFDGRVHPLEGRAAIRIFLEEWFGSYEELEFGLEEVRDLGKGVVFAVVVQNGRPVGSAGHVRQREGWVYVWVGGLVARLTTSEVDEARAAAERLAEERG